MTQAEPTEPECVYCNILSSKAIWLRGAFLVCSGAKILPKFAVPVGTGHSALFRFKVSKVSPVTCPKRAPQIVRLPEGLVAGSVHHCRSPHGMHPAFDPRIPVVLVGRWVWRFAAHPLARPSEHMASCESASDSKKLSKLQSLSSTRSIM